MYVCRSIDVDATQKGDSAVVPDLGSDYFTISVKVSLCEMEPLVAVTVTL